MTTSSTYKPTHGGYPGTVPAPAPAPVEAPAIEREYEVTVDEDRGVTVRFNAHTGRAVNQHFDASTDVAQHLIWALGLADFEHEVAESEVAV